MEITVRNNQNKIKVDEEIINILKEAIRKTLEIENRPRGEVNVLLSDDSFIKELNNRYRGINRPTDVLSFAIQENAEDEPFIAEAEDLLGDVIVSAETAERQAKEYDHSLTRELSYLTIHGVLHLLGYDHQNEDQKKKMRAAEENILSAINVNR